MLKQYLQQICQELSLSDELAPSKDGSIPLEIEEHVQLNFKENPDETIFMSSTCAPIPKKFTDEYLQMIMKAHLFGKETGRCFFGLDGKEENLLLLQLLPPRLGYSEFHSELEDFLNYLDSWRVETQEFIKSQEKDEKA